MEDVQDGIKVSIQDGVKDDPKQRLVYMRSGTARLFLATAIDNPEIEVIYKGEIVSPEVVIMTTIFSGVAS